jgi:hypothetical protein
VYGREDVIKSTYTAQIIVRMSNQCTVLAMRTYIPRTTEEIEGLRGMVKGSHVLQETRDQDSRTGPAVGAVYYGHMVTSEVQPALYTIALAEDAV